MSSPSGFMNSPQVQQRALAGKWYIPDTSESESGQYQTCSLVIIDHCQVNTSIAVRSFLRARPRTQVMLSTRTTSTRGTPLAWNTQKVFPTVVRGNPEAKAGCSFS